MNEKSKIRKLLYLNFTTSLVAKLVKNLPAMRETWVRSLGWEDALEKGKATHSSILAWRCILLEDMFLLENLLTNPFIFKCIL